MGGPARRNHAVPCLAAIAATFAAICAAAQLQPNAWTKVAESQTGERTGAVLLLAPGLKKMLLFGGSVKNAAYMQAFDPATRSWTDAATATPKARRGIHPHYQAVCDPKDDTLYCLHEGTLHTFDISTSEWTDRGRPPALEGMSWHATAIDPTSRRIVVVGADKRPGNIGWTRTAILDLASGTWSTLPLPDARVAREHGELVAAREALIDLIGHTRLAWYRDPKGTGTPAERNALATRCSELARTAAMRPWASQLGVIAAAIAGSDLLGALRAERALQREMELATEEQYPVPPSRRNSPLVFDPASKLFVLFGGDHEDYQMNDTWVLDLARQAWQRARPPKAPAPRAGHQLVALPASGRIALIGGYVASSNPDYRSRQWQPVGDRALWLYDAKANRWSAGTVADAPDTTGTFYGYSGQWYSAPAVAATEDDLLVLAAPAGRKRPSATWLLRFDPASLQTPADAGAEPNQRRYRTGRFLAEYCEAPHADDRLDLDALPANQWVKFPTPARNPAHGCRQRDWGTSIWDSANEQVLLWGGGHCVRSASTVLHFSPVSAKMVEGYDADEPYGYNGGGGFGSSLWNRPWVPVHGYNLYAYDPRCRLVLTATGYFYDPARMDWLRREPMERPFRFIWGHTVLETTPHGVLAWAQAAKGERTGLWLFDHEKGWTDLEPTAKLYSPYCDSEGMVYDSRRDRMLLGWGGGYAKKGDGSLTLFDFKTRSLQKTLPANAELGKLRNTREMVYLAHADCVLFGSTPYATSKAKDAKQYTVVYDCAKNRYLLLDAGATYYGHSSGWVYDAVRKLVYVLTHTGRAAALRLDPASVRFLEKPPADEEAPGLDM